MINRDNNNNDDNDDFIKDCIKVIEPMKWIASISRSDVLKDLLALSLINLKNRGDNNNNNTHNHGEDDAHTNDAIGRDASIQQVTCMSKNVETSNGAKTNRTKKRKNILTVIILY